MSFDSFQNDRCELVSCRWIEQCDVRAKIEKKKLRVVVSVRHMDLLRLYTDGRETGDCFFFFFFF